MKRKDFYIIALFVAIAGAMLIFFSPRGNPPAQNADTYLRVQVGRETVQVIPLNEKKQVTIDQKNGRINVIQTDINAAHMFSSTCKNQQCVHQGTVSLSNRDSRALYNQIICLPNQVILELLTREEAIAQELLSKDGTLP